MTSRLPKRRKTRQRLKSLLRSASETERKEVERLLSPSEPVKPEETASSRVRYCPHAASAKQQLFLSLTCREALFGGAAGGGKSQAILMGALQNVHIPGYAALILRKDTQRLQLAGGLIPRSQQWLAGTEAVWNQAKLTWKFPTAGAPATLSFGYLQTAADKYRYGSSEYQYIAFDELTEFTEEDYRFLFSRLRSSKSIDVPLRMRSASNPGGPGHAWVKSRFVDCGMQNADCGIGEREIYWKNGIAFIPARIADNPGLDADEYGRSLSHLPSVLRQRLERGDWSVHEAGLIRQTWLRYYSAADRMLNLLTADGKTLARVDQRNCRRFATIDPAGTSEDRAREKRGRAASYTALAVWDQPRAKELSSLLILRHVARRRVGFDGLCALLRETQRDWRCAKLFIENEKLGQAAVDVLRGELPIRTIATGGRDKVTRAAPLVAKLERGEIFLPRLNNSWLGDFEAELLSWTGLDDETTDQIDAAAYAVVVASQNSRQGSVKIGPVVVY